MKLSEKYLIKKDEDSNKLYLFKVGNFYLFLNEDAKRISEITTLKLSNVGNVYKCGFPINSIDKYLKVFNNLNLNVEVVEEEINKEENKTPLEELMIYKQYYTMMLYIEKITLKYPKYEKYALVKEIKRLSYKGIELIIKIDREYDKKFKLALMKELDNVLKTMQVLVRISYNNKYINNRNYEAWSRKIYNIGNLLGGWINSCLKV